MFEELKIGQPNFRFLAVPLLVLQCGPVYGDVMSQVLTETVDNYFEHWLNGDVDAMVDTFTEDSVYHANGGESVVGREALRDYYQAFVDNYRIELKWRYELATSFGADGQVMGVYSIRYAPKAGGDEIARGGRFFMLLEQGADGRWRISRELTQSTEDPVPEFR